MEEAGKDAGHVRIGREITLENGVVQELGRDDTEDAKVLGELGYKPELHRNRSMYTLLFQSLAIAAIPYGEGSPLISAIYGGGPLAIFVGWIVVLVVSLPTLRNEKCLPTSAWIPHPQLRASRTH